MKALEFEAEVTSIFSATINGYVVEDEKVYDTIINILTVMRNNWIKLEDPNKFIKTLIDVISQIKDNDESTDGLDLIEDEIISATKNCSVLSDLSETLYDLTYDVGYIELEPLYQLTLNG